MRAVLCACAAILLARPAAAQTVPKRAHDGVVWDTSPTFAFAGKPKDPNKTRRSLSGIACPDDTKEPRRCVAVFDEGREARYVIIDGTRFMPQPDHIVLLPGDNGELDAEAAAQDGTFVYVTGSHSSKRDGGSDGCTINKHSRHVYRLPLLGKGFVGKPVDDKGRLWDLMSNNPVLGPFVGKCLGEKGHGVNIEGLAVRDGQLYFGFREPAQDKTAYILRLDARALFESGDLRPRLFKVIRIGKASGIRDMLAVKEGLLVLVGPDDDSKKDVPWWIGFWDGKGGTGDEIELRPLAQLELPAASGDDCHREIKPEAITLLADEADHRRILILSDGLCDGGPLSFRIPK